VVFNFIPMKRRLSLIPIALFVCLFLLLSWYVLIGLRTLASQTYVPLVFWAIIMLNLTALLYAIQGMGTRGMGWFFKISTHAFLVLFVGELLFALLLVINDVYRGIYGMFNLLIEHNFLSPARNPYWVGFAIIVFICVVLLFLYGMLRGKYAYRIINHSLYFKDLPEAFDGFKIAQISDVHAGSFTNAKAVQKGIDLIKAQNPDLFVFTGD
jgi:hypothetical protein